MAADPRAKEARQLAANDEFDKLLFQATGIVHLISISADKCDQDAAIPGAAWAVTEMIERMGALFSERGGR